MENSYDLVIIGAGPAGMGAAIYGARGGLKTVLFEKALVGGQINLTAEIENYPGFEDILSGFDLTDKFRRQAARLGAEFKEEEVKRVLVDGNLKTIETAKNTYTAKAVIYAAGASPSKLNIPGEKEYTGKGVSYCATCDGALYRNKTVAVVGGGDSAVEEAVFLTKFASKVYIIHRRSKLRAVYAAQQKVFKNDKIEIVWDSVPLKINGSQFVESVTVKNKKTGVENDLPIDGIFIYVGIEPVNYLIKDTVKLTDRGFIIADAEMQTNIPGFYGAGDIVDKTLRQVVTAVSDGAIAAFSAGKWIEDNFE